MTLPQPFPGHRVSLGRGSVSMRYLIPLLFMTGCWTPPEGSVSLSTDQGWVDTAEAVADLLEAPEACRDWNRIGVYVATSPEDFEEATGHCMYRPGYWDCWTGFHFSPVAGSEFDHGIVLGYDVPRILAHEVAHAMLACMGMDYFQNSSHGHWIFKYDFRTLRP